MPTPLIPAPIRDRMIDDRRICTQSWMQFFNSLVGGGGGAGGFSFGTIAVTGDPLVQATQPNDTLTLLEGANISITTDPVPKAVTWAVSPSGPNYAVQTKRNGVLYADAAFTYNEGVGIGPESVAGSAGSVFGVARPTILDVEQALGDTSGPTATAILATRFTPTTASATAHAGINAYFEIAGSVDVGSTQTGVQSELDHVGTGVLAFGIGVNGEAFGVASGRATLLHGVNGGAGSYGSGDVDASVAVAATIVNQGAGTITDAHGIRVYGPNGAGAMTTAYGIRVNDISGASTNYAWYSGIGAIRMGEIAAAAGQTYTVLVDDNGVLSSGSGGGGSAPASATFLTATDESGTLPNSRQLLAGTNVTFDDSVPNERTINASGGGSGTDYVVLGNGVQPPTPMDDGMGSFIYVGYAA
jgi:hypothetical protein